MSNETLKHYMARAAHPGLIVAVVSTHGGRREVNLATVTDVRLPRVYLDGTFPWAGSAFFATSGANCMHPHGQNTMHRLTNDLLREATVDRPTFTMQARPDPYLVELAEAQLAAEEE